MAEVIHTWVARARCSCGFLWTTPNSPNVICACGSTSITDNTASDTLAFTEDEFKAAVASAISESVEDIVLIQQV